jgi:GGDEF domain-containing protein
VAAEHERLASGSEALPFPTGLTDLFTSTDGPSFWDRVLMSEEARDHRTGRASAVVLVEFVGVETTAAHMGREAFRQFFIRLAHLLSTEIRSSDHIARIGRARFGILLVETDEIAAINFVDRLRAACQPHLGHGDTSLRMGIGWASPHGDASLAEAMVIAEERLAADLTA